MKKVFFIFLISLLFLNFLHSDKLKILWWNVYNFFDNFDDPDKDDTLLSVEDYQNRLSFLSSELKKIDADIVGVAEVENINVLKDIALITDYKYYYLEEGNDPRGIDIGLLSKYNIDYFSNRDRLTPYEGNLNYKFSRDCPVAILKRDNTKFYIILAHLKSKFGDDEQLNLKKQNAQVFGILDIIDEIYKNDNSPNIILTGDFNSYRHSEPLNILEKSGLLIINYLYKEDYSYTFIYKKKKNDLDYFIINNDLNKIMKHKSLKTLHDKKFFKISDHFPMIFEFNY